MATEVVLINKRTLEKRRAYALLLTVLVGLGALWAFVALSLDTTAQAGTDGGSQSASAAPDVVDCGLDWAVVSSPNQGSNHNVIQGVAAVATNDVWAVGYYNDGSGSGGNRTLTQHWNGSAWSVVPSPNQGSLDNSFAAVSAIGTNDVWAVGLYNSGSAYLTLTEHWNGSAWSVVPGGNVGSSNSNVLNGVAAVGANDVWAVGFYHNGPVYNTLTEHWDGSTWSVVASPNPGPSDNELFAVAAVATNDVWAVGFAGDTALGVTRDNVKGSTGPMVVIPTLIEHWDGSAWSVVASPNPGTFTNYLYGVTAISANDVWAVGYYDTNNGDRTLIEHWNGSAWSVVTSPNPGTAHNHLNAVAAAGTNSVWAVGDYNTANGFSAQRTLVERWDGTSWQFVYSPNQNIQSNSLRGVDAVSPNDVWAAGDYWNDTNVMQTLVERYNPCTGTPTPVPSACPIQYTDVHPGSTFYDYVRCLACRNIVGGYQNSPPCTTGAPCFLPGNNVTRGQMAKFISRAANYQDVIPPNQQTFTDVPPSHTYWLSIERVYLHGIVSGYTAPSNCPTGVPCYLPGNNVTRGQAARFISRAANYQDAIPANQQSFTDVAPGDTFWLSIERVYMHGIVAGYQNSPPCTTGTPCYQPGNNVTRGQAAKFVSKAFFPDCSTP